MFDIEPKSPGPKVTRRRFGQRVLAGLGLLTGFLSSTKPAGAENAPIEPGADNKPSQEQQQLITYFDQVFRPEFRTKLPKDLKPLNQKPDKGNEIRLFTEMSVVSENGPQTVMAVVRKTPEGQQTQIGAVVFETTNSTNRPTPAELPGLFGKYYQDFPADLTPDKWQDGINPHFDTPSFEVLIPNPDGTTISWAASQIPDQPNNKFTLIRSIYTSDAARFKDPVAAPSQPAN